jgi:FKBP-type peptidyl-prolyl cis-trans isomerase FkpA
MNDDMKLPTREEEMTLLKTYLGNLVTKGYNIDTTDLGVYYVTLDKGEGPKAQMGDTLTVGYAGYFVNGFMFDSSTLNSVDEKWTFVLGNPPMIKGWDDGMKVMNKNSRVQIILPSDLAYGETGSGIIGPYRTLVFVVKIHDLKPKLK